MGREGSAVKGWSQTPAMFLTWTAAELMVLVSKLHRRNGLFGVWGVLNWSCWPDVLISAIFPYSSFSVFAT